MLDLTDALKAPDSFDAPAQGAGGLAWDGSHLWLADFAAHRLLRLDPATLSVVGSLKAHGMPAGLAWDGSRLWQAVFNAGVAVGLDPSSGEVVARAVLPEDQGLVRLAGLAWDGTYLWCASQQDGRLLAMDLPLETVAHCLQSIAPLGDLAWDGSCLWVGGASGLRWDGLAWQETEAQQYVLVCLDPASGREVRRHSLPFWPMGMAWANDDLWISDSQRRRLHRVRAR